MTVTLDAVGPGSTGATTLGASSPISVSWTHTASGSNRAVIVGAAFGNANPASVTSSCTYDGVAMTSLGRIASNNNTAGFVEIFGLVNPPTGAKTVVASCNGSGHTVVAGSISFTGVDQTTPFGTAVTAANDNTSGTHAPTASVSSASGNLVVDAVCYGSALSGATGTQRWLNNFDLNSAAGCAASSTYSGSSTVTVGYNPTAHDWWGLVAVDVKAAAGGGSTDHPATAAPSVTATLTPGGVHVRPATVTGTAVATLTPTPHQGHGAAVTGTAVATLAATPHQTHGAAISAGVGASLTPAAHAIRAAAISSTVGVSLTPAGILAHAAAITAAATPELFLSPSGHNQGAIASAVTATLAITETHGHASALTLTVAATLTPAAVKTGAHAINAAATARMVATVLAALSRDISITYGRPELGWRFGPVEIGWQTSGVET